MKVEDNRVMKDHDRTGKLVEARSHKVQEVGSLIVMTRTSSTLRLMTKTSTSTSQVCQMRW